MRRVPVGELRVPGAGLAVAVGLDREQVGGARRARSSANCGRYSSTEAVNELTSTSVGSEASYGLAEPVADGRGAEVGHPVIVAVLLIASLLVRWTVR